MSAHLGKLLRLDEWSYRRCVQITRVVRIHQMNIDSNEIASAFAVIGAYCLSIGDCDNCPLSSLCANNIADALYIFALQAAVKV